MVSNLLSFTCNWYFDKITHDIVNWDNFQVDILFIGLNLVIILED